MKRKKHFRLKWLQRVANLNWEMTNNFVDCICTLATKVKSIKPLIGQKLFLSSFGDSEPIFKLTRWKMQEKLINTCNDFYFLFLYFLTLQNLLNFFMWLLLNDKENEILRCMTLWSEKSLNIWYKIFAFSPKISSNHLS